MTNIPAIIGKPSRLLLKAPAENEETKTNTTNAKSSLSLSKPSNEADLMSINETLQELQRTFHPKGYIKYPAYDFF